MERYRDDFFPVTLKKRLHNSIYAFQPSIMIAPSLDSSKSSAFLILPGVFYEEAAT